MHPLVATGARPALVYRGCSARSFALGQPSIYSRLHASWATTDPVVAALYAGRGGWVMPFALAEGAAVLDASGGEGGRPLHYMGERLAALRAAAAERWDGTLDCLDTDKLADDKVPPLGPDGTPAWEAVVWEDVDCEDLGAVLRQLGFQAVVCTEPFGNVAGDLETRLRKEPPSSAMAVAWTVAQARMGGRRGFLDAVAFLDPAAGRPAGNAVPADRVFEAVAAGRLYPRTDVADLVAGASPPPAAEPERASTTFGPR